MDKDIVLQWLADRLGRFITKENVTGEQIDSLIGELRAIADEAELRLKHPNFPSKD